MGQDDGIQSAIPAWYVAVQIRDQNVRVRAAVNQDAAAAISLEQNRVALADVENDDVDAAVRPCRDH